MAEHSLLFPLQTSEENPILCSTELGDVSLARLSSAHAPAPHTNSPNWHQQRLTHVLHTEYKQRAGADPPQGPWVSGSQPSMAPLGSHTCQPCPPVTGLPDCATPPLWGLSQSPSSHLPTGAARGIPSPAPGQWGGETHTDAEAPAIKTSSPSGHDEALAKEATAPGEHDAGRTKQEGAAVPGGLGRDLGCQLLPLASPGIAEVAGSGPRCCGSCCLPFLSGAWAGAEDQRALLLLQPRWEPPFLLLFCSAPAHLPFLAPLPLSP